MKLLHGDLLDTGGEFPVNSFLQLINKTLNKHSPRNLIDISTGLPSCARPIVTFGFSSQS